MSKSLPTALQVLAFYVVSGHGGPDPGAIGRVGKHELHEDEYAYDIALRLARNPMQEGAEVHIIIQDAKRRYSRRFVPVEQQTGDLHGRCDPC